MLKKNLTWLLLPIVLGSFEVLSFGSALSSVASVLEVLPVGPSAQWLLF